MTLSNISVFNPKHRCIFQHFIHICETCINALAPCFFCGKLPRQSGEMPGSKGNSLFFSLIICRLQRRQYWVVMLISPTFPLSKNIAVFSLQIPSLTTLHGNHIKVILIPFHFNHRARACPPSPPPQWCTSSSLFGQRSHSFEAHEQFYSFIISY